MTPLDTVEAAGRCRAAGANRFRAEGHRMVPVVGVQLGGRGHIVDEAQQRHPRDQAMMSAGREGATSLGAPRERLART
jgi:hypothetical protein